MFCFREDSSALNNDAAEGYTVDVVMSDRCGCCDGNLDHAIDAHTCVIRTYLRSISIQLAYKSRLVHLRLNVGSVSSRVFSVL